MRRERSTETLLRRRGRKLTKIRFTSVQHDNMYFSPDTIKTISLRIRIKTGEKGLIQNYFHIYDDTAVDSTKDIIKNKTVDWNNLGTILHADEGLDHVPEGDN